MVRVICAGFGGQGVLTAGLVLAEVAMNYGKKVTWVPSYGSEMRGGTASCRLRIRDTEILNPFFEEADLLIAMNQNSLDTLQGQVVQDGVIVSNSTMVNVSGLRSGVRVVETPATAVAAELKNPRGANLVMLGAAVAAIGLFPAEAFADGIDAYFAGKGHGNPLNRACFLRGAATAGRG
ncbi:MAG: hypothetical protein AUJ49_07160 [Desulfovibrionaceae bacterium CG1_02_65_16]|nr:MAG: hypothetical protein AUJ49_07160 [Desulfovibrionaceae bacterium CG1_02_65_16]